MLRMLQSVNLLTVSYKSMILKTLRIVKFANPCEGLAFWRFQNQLLFSVCPLLRSPALCCALLRSPALSSLSCALLLRSPAALSCCVLLRCPALPCPLLRSPCALLCSPALSLRSPWALPALSCTLLRSPAPVLEFPIEMSWGSVFPIDFLIKI